ncbi:MAG: PAS domain S-box protein, partial [Gammaproteobacteria bacterium]|nr:PAS domain S-box protein [Gammaproteobacteria bacterium]
MQTKEALLESEARFRNMADSAPALLWVSEADGSCSFVSRAWCDYTGQSQQQALGVGWLQAVHSQQREKIRAVLLAASERHEPFSLDCRLRRADGEYRWVVHECRPRWSAANLFQGHIGSVIDVHERKLAEQALKEADRRKDEFLATLAHELRNPLAPLRNSLHLLRMVEGSPPVQRVHEIMDRQVNHMVRLVDDLLEVSRITRGKINLQREVVEIAAV